jgi:hypothetical protein
MSMSSGGKRVLRGWAQLNSADQEEVAQEIQRIRETKDQVQKRMRINEAQSVSPGPLNSTCECCGR